MVVEWIHNEESNTLGHVAQLELDGQKSVSPQHALTLQDLSAISTLGKHAPTDNIVVAGESISYQTFQGVGKQAGITDSLMERLKLKSVSGRINLVYPRIPSSYNLGETIVQVITVDDLQASALAGAQLEAGASAIIPPLPNGLKSFSIFERALERTKIEIQTFRKEKEIVGFIPKTDHLDLIPQMIKEYVKNDVSIFAIDFSGSCLPRALIRTTVRAIREAKKIKKKNEPSEKHYYLHVFDVAASLKSVQGAAPITDILTHAYGVDSTSGVMWGGGKLERGKLRYFNMADYGAYRIGNTKEFGIAIPFDVPDNPVNAYKSLRAHRILDYTKDCKGNITERISSGDESKGYAAYLNSKDRAKKEVRTVLSDIKEIRAV